MEDVLYEPEMQREYLEFMQRLGIDVLRIGGIDSEALRRHALAANHEVLRFCISRVQQWWIGHVVPVLLLGGLLALASGFMIGPEAVLVTLLMTALAYLLYSTLLKRPAMTELVVINPYVLERHHMKLRELCYQLLHDEKHEAGGGMLDRLAKPSSAGPATLRIIERYLRESRGLQSAGLGGGYVHDPQQGIYGRLAVLRLLTELLHKDEVLGQATGRGQQSGLVD
ncbi:hypothetical protein KDL29_05695 [bacterium]|nr:hypothetical protein [bacterium]